MLPLFQIFGNIAFENTSAFFVVGELIITGSCRCKQDHIAALRQGNSLIKSCFQISYRFHMSKDWHKLIFDHTIGKTLFYFGIVLAQRIVGNAFVVAARNKITLPSKEDSAVSHASVLVALESL